MLKKGDRVGRYTIASKGIDGTSGRVYKVRDERGNFFAIKVLAITPNKEWTRRFKGEFEILRKCDHPSILRVYKYGKVDLHGDDYKKPYIVMEFLDGKNLNSLRGAVPSTIGIQTATKYIRSAARALEYAHGRSIVHRDIKPANIIVRNSDDSVVVVDFGFAKDFEEPSGDATFFQQGARAYSCAHKTRDPRHATFSDDIWSLGAVYYFLLTGKQAFFAETEHDLNEAIRNGQYEDVRAVNTNVPEEIAQIVRKMLGTCETSDYKNCRYLLRDIDRLELFQQEINRVFLSQNPSTERLVILQQLVIKVYGPVNSLRTSHEMCLRLMSAMGRTNAFLVELGTTKRKDPVARQTAAEHLARSFLWLCSLAVKLGIDLESAVWAKFPAACPYCLRAHSTNSTCTKATKNPIDIWRLRDLSNQRAAEIPQSLRKWELMFSAIYPQTALAGFDSLSKKLIEEMGEVSGELMKPKKRMELLLQTGVDSYAFEIADVFAWMCQVSNALREDGQSDKKSCLAEALCLRLQYELCAFCKNAICVCDPERETEQKRLMAFYLDHPIEVLD